MKKAFTWKPCLNLSLHNIMKPKTTTLTVALAALFSVGSASAAISIVTHETFNDSLGVFTSSTGTGNAGFVDGDASVTGDRAVDFVGTGGIFQDFGVAQTNTDFGVEVIASFDSLPGFSFPGGVTNGDNNGLATVQVNADATGILQGNTQFGTAGGIATDTYYRFAVVREGTTTRFYVNNVLSGSTTDTAPALSSFTRFNIAFNTLNGGNPEGYFDGQITEARLFTFDTGGFDAGTDLLTATTVPEPSSFILVALAGLVLLYRRRR